MLFYTPVLIIPVYEIPCNLRNRCAEDINRIFRTFTPLILHGHYSQEMEVSAATIRLQYS